MINFSKKNLQYDEFALLQKESSLLLVDFIKKSFKNNKSCEILDIGCGTGFLSSSFLDAFPNSKLTALDRSQKILDLFFEKKIPAKKIICNDFLEYNFKKKYDILISNFCLQWCGLSGLKKAMEVGKICYVAFPVFGSFVNAIEYSKKNNLNIDFLEFLKEEQIFHVIKNTAFSYKIKELTQKYDNFYYFLLYLNKIGATTKGSKIDINTLKKLRLDKNEFIANYRVIFLRIEKIL